MVTTKTVLGATAVVLSAATSLTAPPMSHGTTTRSAPREIHGLGGPSDLRRYLLP